MSPVSTRDAIRRKPSSMKYSISRTGMVLLGDIARSNERMSGRGAYAKPAIPDDAGRLEQPPAQHVPSTATGRRSLDD